MKTFTKQRKIFKKHSLIIIFALIASCKLANYDSQALFKIQEKNNDLIILNKWEVLGPFNSDGSDDILDIDYFKQYGFKEGDITFSEYINLKIDSNDHDSINTVNLLKKEFWHTDNTISDVKKFFSIEDEQYRGTAYFGCSIDCDNEIETYLHFSSSTSDKIWLNNELVSTANHIKKIVSYQHFVPIKLKKGANFLLVRTSQNRDAWNIYARLEKFSQYALERQLNQRNQCVLQDHVFNGDSIRLNSQTPAYNGVLTVYDNSWQPVLKDEVSYNQEWKANFSTQPKGLYHAKYKVDEATVSHDFFKGDLHDSIKTIINCIQEIKVSEAIKSNIDAAVFRYNYLEETSYPTNKEFVSLFIQLHNIFIHLKKSDNPFNHTPGWHIRSYMSDIDDSRQYYILHIPTTYKKNTALPCAIIAPVIIGTKLPYLESFRLGNIFLINHLQSLAEKHNIIIIQPGSRRFQDPNFNNIEETELCNIIYDVKKDYSIDHRQLYLLGACGSAQDALKAATQYPHKYAAIGLIAAEIIYPNEAQESVIPYLKNITNLPIYVTHSSLDTNTPVLRSRLLAKMAKQEAFKNFKYVELPNEFPLYYSDDFFDAALEFCLQYKRNDSPNEIYFSTSNIHYNKSFWITLTEIEQEQTAEIHAKLNKSNRLKITKKNILNYKIDFNQLDFNKDKRLKVKDNGKLIFHDFIRTDEIYFGDKASDLIKSPEIAGPLSHLFSQRFIVVKGSTGTKAESSVIDSVANILNDLWYERYYANFIVKNDFEITEDDHRNANLLLLGNYQSNFLLKEMENKLPLAISEKEINIFEKTIEGTGLSFYLIYPNPFNQKKYVGIIGYNDIAKLSLGAETNELDDISNYGWFDYKIWKNNYETLESGYFNSKWKINE